MRFLSQGMSLSAISLHFPAGLKLSVGQFAGWKLILPAGLAVYIFGVSAFFVTASLPSVQLACWHSAAPRAGCPGVSPLCPLCPAWGAFSSTSCSSLCALRGCGGLTKEPSITAGGSGRAGGTLSAPGGARCSSCARGGSVLFAGLCRAELFFLLPPLPITLLRVPHPNHGVEGALTRSRPGLEEQEGEARPWCWWAWERQQIFESCRWTLFSFSLGFSLGKLPPDLAHPLSRRSDESF